MAIARPRGRGGGAFSSDPLVWSTNKHMHLDIIPTAAYGAMVRGARRCQTAFVATRLESGCYYNSGAR